MEMLAPMVQPDPRVQQVLRVVRVHPVRRGHRAQREKPVPVVQEDRRVRPARPEVPE